MGLSEHLGVVWDFGNVLVDWQPALAIAAGVGADEAARFLAAEDFDFMAWNHGPDSGRSWDDAEDEVRSGHPHWVEHATSYRRHFAASLAGEVPGSFDLVRELHAAGVTQWGLTNWSHELYPHAPERFADLALLDGVAKPDPEVFELVASRSGLALTDLVFVDDKQLNVDAAIALGMHGIVFTSAADTRARLRELGLPV